MSVAFRVTSSEVLKCYNEVIVYYNEVIPGVARVTSGGR
jgi:hypothetical protein